MEERSNGGGNLGLKQILEYLHNNYSDQGLIGGGYREMS